MDRDTLLTIGTSVFVISLLSLSMALIAYGLYGLWHMLDTMEAEPLAIEQQEDAAPPYSVIEEAELIVEMYLHRLEKQNDARS